MKSQPLKKHLSLWLFTCLLIALIVSATGCQPKLTAKETYERMQSNALTQAHASLSFSGDFGITFDEQTTEALKQDPATGTLVNMFKNVTFKGKGQYQKTDRIGKMGLNYDLDLNGLTMKMDLFFDEEQLIVKYPLFPQYLVLNVEEGIAKINELGDLNLTYTSLLEDYNTLIQGWYPEYVKQHAATFEETDIELLDKYDFTVDGKTVSSKAIRLKMDVNTFVKSNEALVKSLSESQQIYDLLKKYDINSELGTFEEYQSELKTQLEAMDLGTADPEAMAMLEKMTMDYVIGFDKSYRMTYVDFSLDMPIEDPSIGAVTLKMSMDAAMSYDPVEIVFPELTEDNQLSIIDFMMQNLPSNLGTLPNLESQPKQTPTFSEGIWPIYDAEATYLAEEIAKADGDKSRIDEILASYSDDIRPELVYVYFAGADKVMQMVPNTELPKDYDPTTRPFYTEAVTNYTFASEPYEDATNGRMIQTVAKPVEVNGKIIGVIGIDFYID